MGVLFSELKDLRCQIFLRLHRRMGSIHHSLLAEGLCKILLDFSSHLLVAMEAQVGWKVLEVRTGQIFEYLLNIERTVSSIGWRALVRIHSHLVWIAGSKMTIIRLFLFCLDLLRQNCAVWCYAGVLRAFQFQFSFVIALGAGSGGRASSHSLSVGYATK